MEYHKIETLFDRDERTHKVNPDKLRNPVYGIFKTWQFTEKIDGTNIRVIWDAKLGAVRFSGRTDKAQIHADLIAWLQHNVTVEKMRIVFAATDAVIYGEGYGAGIQNGSGYSKTKQFIIFDVLVDGKFWLSWDNTCDVAKKLGLDTVPFVGEMTLEQGIDMVRRGFPSILAKEQTGEIVQAEGLVGRTVEPIFDKLGNRVIIKLKTRDF